MKQDHSPWDEKNFQAGANTDLDGTSVARMPGAYRDARNMRVADNKGNNGSLIKIGGEVVSVAADRPGADTYVCIGAIEVKGRAVTFWASTHPDDYPPIIQIGGITMVMSFQLPYKWNKKLQLSKSEDCKGGLVFDARSGGIPLQWDIAGHHRGIQQQRADLLLCIQYSRLPGQPGSPGQQGRVHRACSVLGLALGCMAGSTGTCCAT
jgi:hypothetical protein